MSKERLDLGRLVLIVAFAKESIRNRKTLAVKGTRQALAAAIVLAAVRPRPKDLPSHSSERDTRSSRASTEFRDQVPYPLEWIIEGNGRDPVRAAAREIKESDLGRVSAKKKVGIGSSVKKEGWVWVICQETGRV